MRNKTTWKSELFDEIRTISDKNLLRQLWFGGNLHQTSSFSEQVSLVFDNFEINNFIESGYSTHGLNKMQLNAIKNFRDKFLSYTSYLRKIGALYNQKFIFDDPKWNDVINSAVIFIKSIDDENK